MGRGLWSVVSKVYFFPSGIKPAQPINAGGYTVPDVTSATLIDALRASDVVMQAGAIALGSRQRLDFARSDLSRVTFTPRSLAVLVIVVACLIYRKREFRTRRRSFH